MMIGMLGATVGAEDDRGERAEFLLPVASGGGVFGGGDDECGDFDGIEVALGEFAEFGDGDTFDVAVTGAAPVEAFGEFLRGG